MNRQVFEDIPDPVHLRFRHVGIPLFGFTIKIDPLLHRFARFRFGESSSARPKMPLDTRIMVAPEGVLSQYEPISPTRHEMMAKSEESRYIRLMRQVSWYAAEAGLTIR